MSDQKPLIYGIIHIGSSNVSMRIVQYNSVKDIRVIESVRKDTTFGEEVFNQKRLSFPSIKKLCRMLEGLKQLLVLTHPTKPIVLRLLYQSASFIMGKILSY